ncbi:MAG: glycosyltransferase [Clostridiales bacterium]|nr:glycosyltransferase [Clostridiales bacterium]
MKPEVSVIIPVFNTEKYVDACIESVLKQTYTSFELVLVDDGSTDASGKICDEYSRRDCRIKVIHQENQGVSCARNTGLDQATGTYIAFADSDDILNDTMLEICMRCLNQNRMDFIWFNIETKGESGHCHWNNPVVIGIMYLTTTAQKTDLILNQYLEYQMTFSVFNKVYRKKFLDLNEIRFDQKVRIGEDLAFNLKCFMAADAVCGIPGILYQYWWREDSAVNSEGVTAIYIRDYALIAQSIEQYAKKKKVGNGNFMRIYIKLMDGTYHNRTDRKEYREKVMKVENKFYLFCATVRALCHPFMFAKIFGSTKKGAGKWKDHLYILKYLFAR